MGVVSGRMRPVVVATRFTRVEVEAIDAARGSLTVAAWLRKVALEALKPETTSDTP